MRREFVRKVRQAARVVSGVWLEAQETFVLETDDGKQLVQKCRALSFMAASHLQLASRHKLLHAIRKSTSSDSELVVIAPYGLSSDPLSAVQIVPIFLVVATFARNAFD